MRQCSSCCRLACRRTHKLIDNLRLFHEFGSAATGGPSDAEVAAAVRAKWGMPDAVVLPSAYLHLEVHVLLNMVVARLWQHLLTPAQTLHSAMALVGARRTCAC